LAETLRFGNFFTYQVLQAFNGHCLNNTQQQKMVSIKIWSTPFLLTSNSELVTIGEKRYFAHYNMCHSFLSMVMVGDFSIVLKQ
jgi:hypothetical protein